MQKERGFFHGNLVAEIIKNEWRTYTSNWDVQREGSRITVRSGSGEIPLVLRADPPDRLVVERIKMSYKEILIEGQEGKEFTVELQSSKVRLIKSYPHNHNTAIEISKNGIVYGSGQNMDSPSRDTETNFFKGDFTIKQRELKLLRDAD